MHLVRDCLKVPCTGFLLSVLKINPEHGGEQSCVQSLHSLRDDTWREGPQEACARRGMGHSAPAPPPCAFPLPSRGA